MQPDYDSWDSQEKSDNWDNWNEPDYSITGYAAKGKGGGGFKPDTWGTSEYTNSGPDTWDSSGYTFNGGITPKSKAGAYVQKGMGYKGGNGGLDHTSGADGGDDDLIPDWKKGILNSGKGDTGKGGKFKGSSFGCGEFGISAKSTGAVAKSKQLPDAKGFHSIVPPPLGGKIGGKGADPSALGPPRMPVLSGCGKDATGKGGNLMKARAPFPVPMNVPALRGPSVLRPSGAPQAITPRPVPAPPRGVLPPSTGVHVEPPPWAVVGGRVAPQHVRPIMAPGMAPELAQLMDAGVTKEAPLPPHVTEKKPRIILLITRLAPELQENHMQQILEQCGPVQAWRRGRGPNGEPLSFGFAQFGDPEAAWLVSTCLSKRALCGQEVKVLVEEQAEAVIQAWRASQQAALKVNTDEELDWELERKAVSCKALIEAKIEELLGPQGGGADGQAPGVAAGRRIQELRDREEKRIDRARKRKAYLEAEFAKELARIEANEKRARREEREKDVMDREREELEITEKESHEEKLAKMEEIANTGGSVLATASAVDAKALYELVDKVQAEPRGELFKMELDVNFLRDEKIFEKKLRPWLERKVDIHMGGPQSDLVEYILRRVNAAAYPDALIGDLSRFLDDNAEVLVERMWRMLVLELTRGGLGLAKQKQPS